MNIFRNLFESKQVKSERLKKEEEQRHIVLEIEAIKKAEAAKRVSEYKRITDSALAGALENHDSLKVLAIATGILMDSINGEAFGLSLRFKFKRNPQDYQTFCNSMSSLLGSYLTERKQRIEIYERIAHDNGITNEEWSNLIEPESLSLVSLLSNKRSMWLNDNEIKVVFAADSIIVSLTNQELKILPMLANRDFEKVVDLRLDQYMSHINPDFPDSLHKSMLRRYAEPA